MEIDAHRGKFVIRCSFHENAIPKNMPKRRWMKAKRYWVADATKINLRYLRHHVTDQFWTYKAIKLRSQLEFVVPTLEGDHAWSSIDLRIEPRQYQAEFLDEYQNSTAVALFVDPRLGKTKMVIDKFCLNALDDHTDALLVFCPSSIKFNWLKELDKHMTIDYDPHVIVSGKMKEYKYWVAYHTNTPVLIVSFEAMSQGRASELVADFVQHAGKVTVAVDESQRIKNPTAIRTKRITEYASHCTIRMTMTGTPITKAIPDMFNQMEVLHTNIIGVGDYYAFRKRYLLMGGYEDKEIVGYQNQQELIEAVTPYIFQRRKKDVFHQLPDTPCDVRYIEPTAGQKEIYRMINKGNILPDKSPVENTLTKALRLHEVVGGFYSTFKGEVKGKPLYEKHPVPGPNPKADELMSLIEENPDERTIVWVKYNHEMDYLADRFRQGGYRVGFIRGGMRETTPYEESVKFQAGEFDILIANTAAGGVGLDLWSAQRVFYYSDSFNWEDRTQSMERIFIPERPHICTVTDLVIPDSIDDRIVEAHQNKTGVSEFFRGSIDDPSLFGDI